MMMFKISTFDGIKLYYQQDVILEGFVQVKITGFCSASDRLSFARNTWVNKLFTIEDICKTSYRSDYENSKLQSPKRSCGKRISHQESKVKNAYVERKVGECFQLKVHGQCSERDSCSFSHDELAQGDLYGGQRRKGRSSSSCTKFEGQD